MVESVHETGPGLLADGNAQLRTEERPSKPWWWRASAFLIEIALIFAIAAAIPRVLSWALRTPTPLATITSSSMWPVLKRGDLVLIEGCEGPVTPGMIVVYNSAEAQSMVIHRVIETDGAAVVTQGDANAEADEPITRSDISGAIATIRGVPLRIPYLGYITMWGRGGG